MGLRIFTEPQQGASYDQLLTVARAAEECGFEAFFRSDHYLKMGTATGMPAYTDAWATLSGLARDTRSIRLGTLVTPVTFRAIGSFPVIASQVDHMSGGRVEVGLGAGWYKEEHEAYGLSFPPVRSRYDMLEDQLAVLHGVWSAKPGSSFEFVGRTVAVNLEAGPLQPLQRPHPPVIVGGRGGPRNARLAATYADEFNISFASLSDTKAAYESVRQACEKAGRDPAQVALSAAQVLCCGKDEKELSRRAEAIGRDVAELRENGFAGTPAEVVEKMAAFAKVGAARFYLQVLDLSDTDHLRLVASEVMPHVGNA
jgi:F420-dependent oxidoreductase-like protein